jgi:hypothetical protein
MRQLKQTFDNIQCKYSGCVRGLIQEVEKLKQEITALKQKHIWELKDKDREIQHACDQHNVTPQIVIPRDTQIENLTLKFQLSEYKKQ